jgi:hypothetical protein
MHFNRLNPAVRELASTSAGRAELLALAQNVRRVYGASDDYADLLDLLALLMRSSSPEVRSIAGEMRAGMSSLIIHRWIDPDIADRAHGLSIYFPVHVTSQGIVDYEQHYAFAEEIGWASVLRAIHGL